MKRKENINNEKLRILDASKQGKGIRSAKGSQVYKFHGDTYFHKLDRSSV